MLRALRAPVRRAAPEPRATATASASVSCLLWSAGRPYGGRRSTPDGPSAIPCDSVAPPVDAFPWRRGFAPGCHRTSGPLRVAAGVTATGCLFGTAATRHHLRPSVRTMRCVGMITVGAKVEPRSARARVARETRDLRDRVIHRPSADPELAVIRKDSSGSRWSDALPPESRRRTVNGSRSLRPRHRRRAWLRGKCGGLFRAG